MVLLALHAKDIVYLNNGRLGDAVVEDNATSSITRTYRNTNHVGVHVSSALGHADVIPVRFCLPMVDLMPTG
jgi:hypothetical protein